MSKFLKNFYPILKKLSHLNSSVSEMLPEESKLALLELLKTDILFTRCCCLIKPKLSISHSNGLYNSILECSFIIVSGLVVDLLLKFNCFGKRMFWCWVCIFD